MMRGFLDSLFGRVMIALLSTISMVLGAAIAYLANCYPAHREIIETVAGILLIGGFALLGYGLECVFGHP
jgi:putative Mn2+ efflux pump MntP